jgi:hypothetical protein
LQTKLNLSTNISSMPFAKGASLSRRMWLVQKHIDEPVRPRLKV